MSNPEATGRKLPGFLLAGAGRDRRRVGSPSDADRLVVPVPAGVDPELVRARTEAKVRAWGWEGNVRVNYGPRGPVVVAFREATTGDVEIEL